MRAATKTGLDYFPFDVGLMKDKKLRRAKLKYGFLATEVYISLLTLLYSDKGYYIPYETDEEKEDCIWYILDCLQGKRQPETDTIAGVVEELVACGLFSGDLYPKIITSERSQAVYYTATIERKSVVINPDFWLLSPDEMKVLSEKHSYYLSLVNRPIIEDNRPRMSENRPRMQQSKEKKRKVYITPPPLPPKEGGGEGETDGTGKTEERAAALQNFCGQYGVQTDEYSPYLSQMDFTRLSAAYHESKNFLQVTPCAKFMSWIVKNYASIVGGKYKDYEKPPSSPKGRGGSDNGGESNFERAQRFYAMYKKQEEEGHDRAE